jgi:protein-L-isoaspartate(D-aspartate) O-methyltransferase
MMEFAKRRKELVKYLEQLGVVATPEIKHTLLKIRRELFIPKDYRRHAYEYNVALPIPGKVTISAMNMHASFLSAAELKRGDKVLEVGAGSGILLAYIKEVVGKAGRVYGIEINPEAYEFALSNLEKTGYGKKIKLILGDGSKGLQEFAPFDKIISSAASPKEIPNPWIEQLKPNGIIVTPVGKEYYEQRLMWMKKIKGRLVKKDLGGVVFIELKGEHGWSGVGGI